MESKLDRLTKQIVAVLVADPIIMEKEKAEATAATIIDQSPDHKKLINILVSAGIQSDNVAAAVDKIERILGSVKLEKRFLDVENTAGQAYGKAGLATSHANVALVVGFVGVVLAVIALFIGTSGIKWGKGAHEYADIVRKTADELRMDVAGKANSRVVAEKLVELEDKIDVKADQVQVSSIEGMLTGKKGLVERVRRLERGQGRLNTKVANLVAKLEMQASTQPSGERTQQAEPVGGAGIDLSNLATHQDVEEAKRDLGALIRNTRPAGRSTILDRGAAPGVRTSTPVR